MVTEMIVFVGDYDDPDKGITYIQLDVVGDHSGPDKGIRYA